MSKVSSFSADESLSDIRIGLESTGLYSINIQNYLLQKRLSVRIFNPLHVNLMRKAKNLPKTKTDKDDSKFLDILLFSDDSKPYPLPVLTISQLSISYPELSSSCRNVLKAEAIAFKADHHPVS